MFRNAHLFQQKTIKHVTSLTIMGETNHITLNVLAPAY